MVSQARRFRPALLGLLIAGCVAQPQPPIFGVWEGSAPGPTIDPSNLIDLVLEGGPTASAGRYRIATTRRGDLQFGIGTGTRRWSGSWTSEPASIDGAPVRVILLHNALAGDIDRYALASNGVLVPVKPNNQPYSRQQEKLYGLRPVPRDSHNYGTL